MKKEYRLKLQKFIGLAIMPIAFPIIPEHSSQYYQVLLFNVGLLLLLSTKWGKLKNELRITKAHL